ncbi:hypothetical protein LCGC14_1746000 [marine sediment metagenome]|uniref:Uncharacterized protein n=1 Tax=marine sediment metagenome TaxID=412755 RepID=A0A0F9JKH2_9ZZZZ
MTDWQLCTSGAAITKAGANANSTIATSGSALLNWYTEAEGYISMLIHTDATTLTGPVLVAAGDICSSKIAMNIIAYDTTGYLSREADTLLNVNDDIITKGISTLREKENQRVSK